MWNSAIEMSGTTWGRLRVLEYSHTSKSGKLHWLCECSCGRRVTVCGSNLRNGGTRCPETPEGDRPCVVVLLAAR
jgi:hypothetical protein